MCYEKVPVLSFSATLLSSDGQKNAQKIFLKFLNCLTLMLYSNNACVSLYFSTWSTKTDTRVSGISKETGSTERRLQARPSRSGIPTKLLFKLIFLDYSLISY